MRRILVAILVALIATVVLGAAPKAQAADPGAEADFANRVNQVRAAHGLGGVATHSVLTAKAEAWAQHMADSGCLCHSNLPDGVTVGWRKLGENIGRGPSVTSIHTALVNSPRTSPTWSILRSTGSASASRTATVRCTSPRCSWTAMRRPRPNPLLAFDTQGRAIAARPQGGFWVMSGDGTVHAYEGAPAYGSPHFPGDYARDIAVDARRQRLRHPRRARRRPPLRVRPVHALGRRRSVVRLRHRPQHHRDPDGKGFAVLDGFGGYHRYGDAPKSSRTSRTGRGWDIARSIAFRPGGGLYMLDGFGGVWARGGATSYGAAYFGWNIARDITVWPDGKGYAVLDGFGGAPPLRLGQEAGQDPLPARRPVAVRREPGGDLPRRAQRRLPGSRVATR